MNGKKLSPAEQTACKNLINLVEEIVKWMAVNVTFHPNNKIKYRSVFKMIFDEFSTLFKNEKTDMGYYKNEDIKKYTKNYH